MRGSYIYLIASPWGYNRTEGVCPSLDALARKEAGDMF